MTMNDALKILDKELYNDYIPIEGHRGINFYDIIVERGGDMYRYRIYDDGRIVEK